MELQRIEMAMQTSNTIHPCRNQALRAEPGVVSQAGYPGVADKTGKFTDPLSSEELRSCLRYWVALIIVMASACRFLRLNLITNEAFFYLFQLVVAKDPVHEADLTGMEPL